MIVDGFPPVEKGDVVVIVRPGAGRLCERIVVDVLGSSWPKPGPRVILSAGDEPVETQSREVDQ